MQRIVAKHPNLQIVTGDEPGPGGANHKYLVELLAEPGTLGITGGTQTHCIRFQKGPVKEAGVNGLTQEALLAIVIDRLSSFQAGPFACDENAIALGRCKAALEILNVRTAARIQRGVEGLNKV